MSNISSVEIVWLALFISALFIVYLSNTAVFYSNLIITQLLIILFIYRYNKNPNFRKLHIVVVIIVQLLSTLHNIPFVSENFVAFIIKTLIILCALFITKESLNKLSNKSYLHNIFSSVMSILYKFAPWIIVIWYLKIKASTLLMVQP